MIEKLNPITFSDEIAEKNEQVAGQSMNKKPVDPGSGSGSGSGSGDAGADITNVGSAYGMISSDIGYAWDVACGFRWDISYRTETIEVLEGVSLLRVNWVKLSLETQSVTCTGTETIDFDNIKYKAENTNPSLKFSCNGDDNKDLDSGATSFEFSFSSNHFNLTVEKLKQDAYGTWQHFDSFKVSKQLTLEIEFDIHPYFEIGKSPKITITSCRMLSN